MAAPLESCSIPSLIIYAVFRGNLECVKCLPCHIPERWSRGANAFGQISPSASSPRDLGTRLGYIINGNTPVALKCVTFFSHTSEPTSYITVMLISEIIARAPTMGRSGHNVVYGTASLLAVFRELLASSCSDNANIRNYCPGPKDGKNDRLCSESNGRVFCRFRLVQNSFETLFSFEALFFLAWLMYYCKPPW